MNPFITANPTGLLTRPATSGAFEIDAVSRGMRASQEMKRSLRETSGFSLVEVTLALGVAAFCLIAVMGLLPAGLKTQQTSIQQTIANDIITEILADLRADVRLPPGQVSREQDSGFGLHGHWSLIAEPDTLFFTSAGLGTGNVAQGDPAAPPEATFRAKITYLSPPSTSTSVAKIVVTWPAQVIPTTGTPAGSAEAFIAVNR